MLFQVGGEGTRPTFFEMAAAQQLPSSLRAALTYSLGVSAVFLVVLPYLKSKLHGVYNQEREARLRESLWGTEEDQGFDEADFFSGEEPVVSRGGSGSQELSVGVQLATRIKKFIAVCYPWIHASCEGLSFTYQLLYLLDASGFYSLGLQALGIQVCRATVQEMMDTSSRISKIRSHERERLRGPPWLKTVQGALLSCSYAVLDYAQTGLIAAVFIFKWWYQSAEERSTAPTVYPPPPPPPSPKVAKEGIPLPPDRTLCALCLQPISCHSLWICFLLFLRVQVCFTVQAMSSDTDSSKRGSD